MTQINVKRGAGQYFDALKMRLRDAGISYGAMSREMGIDITQFSRWMNKRVTNPRLETVLHIEEAFERLTAPPPKRRRKKR